MARRRFPIATVKLHEPGRRYTVQKAAWSFYGEVGKLREGGLVAGTTATAGSLGVVDGEPSDVLPLVGYCEGADVAHCMPFWPQDVPWPSVPSDWWSGADDGVDEVTSLPEVAGRGVMFDGPRAVTSRFTVGRDCWWALVLWREKAEDVQSLGSEVVWGYDGNYVIPPVSGRLPLCFRAGSAAPYTTAVCQASP